MQHFVESERISSERQVEVIRIIRFRLLQERQAKKRDRAEQGSGDAIEVSKGASGSDG
mgnify:CR=1 FL=1